MAAPTTANGGGAMVNVFDGTRNPYSDDAAILITARDGNQKVQSREFHAKPSVFFKGLPLFNNFGDDYAFLAAADGYKDAGFFPVKLAANVDLIVDLMLIPKSNGFNFAQAKWSVLGNARRAFKDLFANGATDDEAATRYSALEERGAILGCLLNITTAMQQINLPQKTALEYLKRIIWDDQGEFAMGQDRRCSSLLCHHTSPLKRFCRISRHLAGSLSKILSSADQSAKARQRPSRSG